jgi:hypothetical protein
MANNYTTFAETLLIGGEAARYAEALDHLAYVLADQGDEGPPPVKLVVSGGEVLVDERMLADARALIPEDDDFFGSSTSFEAGERGLYLASEESGDLEVVAAILQATLRRFSLPRVSVQWADTCSKLRSGEFGGGAVVITQSEIRWMNTNRWVAETLAEIAGDSVKA